MKSSRESWSIGEVAARLGLETHVLRHWEDVGLVRPDRDPAGRRRYQPDDLVRIATVVRSKNAGMTLEQIRDLLDTDVRGRHEILVAHLAELDRRLAEITAARAMTQHAYECRAHDVTSCPHFAAHLEDLVAGFA